MQQVDGNGDVTADSYDPLGRLVAETNPVSGTTAYTYNATEQTQVQDPMGYVNRMSYDPAGRLTQRTDPISGTQQVGYDAVGNTTAISSGDGVVVTHHPDRGHHLDEPTTDTVSSPAAPSEAPSTTLTAYDLDGNVAQVQQPNGDVTYNRYDTADQLLSTEIDPGLLSPTQATTHPAYDNYAYDQAGNAVLHVDADGRTSTTQYDGDNRPVQGVDASGPPTGTTTITTSLGYDPDGDTLSQSTRTTDTSSPGVAQTYTNTDSLTSPNYAVLTTARPRPGLSAARPSAG